MRTDKEEYHTKKFYERKLDQIKKHMEVLKEREEILINLKDKVVDKGNNYWKIYMRDYRQKKRGEKKQTEETK